MNPVDLLILGSKLVALSAFVSLALLVAAIFILLVFGTEQEMHDD